MKNQPYSICILRLSAIGDVCHTLAVVQAIQKKYPNAEITWIIGKVEAMLIEGIPNVILIPYDKKSGIKGIFALWKQLRNKRFDVLLNMQLAIRASLLSVGIKAKKKIGFNRERAKEGQWLFTNAQVEKTTTYHVLDGLMLFAKAIGVTDLNPQWQLALSEEDRQYIDQFIEKDKPLLVIAACSSSVKRDWSPQNYIKIAQFAEQHNLQVILCGSPSEYEMQVADTIHQAVPSTLNLAGKTSLKQLAVLMSYANLVISSDSGPAHIATTQGAKVLGLYAVQNPKRTGPYHHINDVISVYEEAILQEYGKPWQELPWATKAKTANLMDKITVEQVKNKMTEMLNLSNE
ncbi:glycosyltransferase family 9 protein [Otariodibacter sp.]|uniref:glycosyltransferase family 9 protein n=1 Tax=Otariodibacter sp. TaxID=3030919 RepID=UPI00262D9EAA|nr:glycosyltransferase family 9 protein [Otariodibacter sp.]